ncbi:MAG: group 1 truncated hemoglobin [Phycisphaerales bacterium]
MNRNAMVVLFVACAASLTACGGSGARSGPSATGDPEADRRADLRVGQSEQETGPGATLYSRLGGEQAIGRFVDDFTDRVIADPRVNFARRRVKATLLTVREPWLETPDNIGAFKRHLVEFIALAAGGPAAYAGRPMSDVHADMRITNAEFDAMVGDAKASLQRLGVGPREQRDVLAILETTRKQVVERR